MKYSLPPPKCEFTIPIAEVRRELYVAVRRCLLPPDIMDELSQSVSRPRF